MKAARLGHAGTELAVLKYPGQQGTLLSSVHGPEVVLGMLVTVLHLDVVAPHSRFARQLYIPRVVSRRVARNVLALLVGC